MKPLRAFVVLAGILCAWGAAGCVEVDRSIVLNKDLSGTASFRMTMDLEPFVVTLLQMQHANAGKAGPPTAAELAAARQELPNPFARDGLIDATAIAAGLPVGVSLVEATQKPDGFKFTVNVVCAFRDLAKVPLIALPDKRREGQPADVAPFRPFDGLDIKDEGGTVTITSKSIGILTGDDAAKPASAASGAASAPKSPAASAVAGRLTAMVEQLGPSGPDDLAGAMKGMREAFRIEFPFTVLETNGTRKAPNALAWEITGETWEKLSPDARQALTILVRFRKQARSTARPTDVQFVALAARGGRRYCPHRECVPDEPASPVDQCLPSDWAPVR
jgi:hypothetical protein